MSITDDQADMKKRAESKHTIQTRPLADEGQQGSQSPLVEISNCVLRLAEGFCKGHDRSFSAADVRQNVMIRVLQRPGIRIPRDVGLLKRITFHAFIDLVRQNHHYVEDEISDTIGRDASARGLNHEERYQFDEARIREIMTVVLSSDQERMIFTALVEEGRTYAEIAQQSGMSIMAVRVAKRKIHDKILRYLSKGINFLPKS